MGNVIHADAAAGPGPQPKVFISYCWTSPKHQAAIVQLAEELVGDGVDVVLDVYELKEGDDKYAFMERMVTDESVTHVLVASDAEYARRADARERGVGTESQIISQEVYQQVKGSKFVPLVYEFDEQGEPCLPVFLKPRIWVNFSSPEAMHRDWEKLLRHLFGKPAHVKPELGKPPAYISEEAPSPSVPIARTFRALAKAIHDESDGVRKQRREFTASCIAYVDALRVRSAPHAGTMGQKIIADCSMLRTVRDHVTDWVFMECGRRTEPEFANALVEFLERLLATRYRPDEVRSWNEWWFDAHAIFVFETFLYVAAALNRCGSYETVNRIFCTTYLTPETAPGGSEFERFPVFQAHSKQLGSALDQERQFQSPVAELIRRQADREDLPFDAIMEADLIATLMSFIVSDATWIPQTLHYASNQASFPLFQRAARHRDFRKLATITGKSSADEIREAARQGIERLKGFNWSFNYFRSPLEFLNLTRLDTVP